MRMRISRGRSGGLRSVVTDTIMSDIDRAAAAKAVLTILCLRKETRGLTIRNNRDSEITEGIDLGALIGDTCVANDSGLDGDVLVVLRKLFLKEKGDG